MAGFHDGIRALKRINPLVGIDMAAKFKKFFLALVTVFLGAMNSSAIGQTAYDFSYDNGSGVIAQGVFTVNSSNLIIDVTGAVSGSSAGSGKISGVMNKYSINANTNQLFPAINAPNYLDSNGVGFYTNGSNTSANQFVLLQAGTTPILYNKSGGWVGNGGTLTVAAASAVPEIDGALIPQVGLLLAGLFIILGRRKESAEPMLAA